MTDTKIEAVASAADRPVRRSGLGGLIERVGTHNFSLLIALAALIAIFGFLRPNVFFLLRNILTGILARQRNRFAPLLRSQPYDIQRLSVIQHSTLIDLTIFDSRHEETEC